MKKHGTGTITRGINSWCRRVVTHWRVPGLLQILKILIYILRQNDKITKKLPLFLKSGCRQGTYGSLWKNFSGDGARDTGISPGHMDDPKTGHATKNRWRSLAWNEEAETCIGYSIWWAVFLKREGKFPGIGEFLLHFEAERVYSARETGEQTFLFLFAKRYWENIVLAKLIGVTPYPLIVHEQQPSFIGRLYVSLSFSRNIFPLYNRIASRIIDRLSSSAPSG